MSDGFAILRTNHTSFTVSSLDRTLPFFCEALGFQLLSRAPRDPAAVAVVTGVPGADIEVAYVGAPGHRIEFIEYKAPAGRGQKGLRPCDVGFAHIALDVKGLDALLERAAQYGFRPAAPPLKSLSNGPNRGSSVVYVRNEDGLTIELLEQPAG